MFSNATFANFTLQNSSGTGLQIQGVRFLELYNLNVQSCATNVSVSACSECDMIDCSTQFSGANGLVLDSVNSSSVIDCQAASNVGNGFAVQGVGYALRFRNGFSNQNGGAGYLVGGTSVDDTGFVGVAAKMNQAQGLVGLATATDLSVLNCMFAYNGTQGLELHGSSAVVSGNSASYHATGTGFAIDGDDCVVNHNIAKQNFNGIVNTGARNILSSNSSTNNSNFCMWNTSGSAGAIVTDSHFDDGGVSSLQDDSDTSLTGNNLF
jgi:hypothetical protein